PSPLVVENSGRWLGNDGGWLTFYVYAGTPPQHFHVLPSSKGQTLYVLAVEDCERMTVVDCGRSRGVEIFDQRPSLGFQKNRSSTWEEIGIYRLDLDTNLGLSGNGVFGYGEVGLSSSGAIDSPRLNHQVISAYATPDLWTGQLGLSMYALNFSADHKPHSLLSSLKEQGSIPSLSFGYNAGAPYGYTKIRGSLTLGGYDRSRKTNDTVSIPITEDLFVGLQNISTTITNCSVSLLNDGILSVIDTTLAELWLPQSACDKFATAFNLTYFKAADRYVLTNDAHEELRRLAPNISLTIGTSVSGEESLTIDIPYAAFDQQATYPVFANATNYFPIRRAANDSQYTIGRVFLQEVYMTVDFERDVFNTSKALFSSPMLEADLVAIPPVNKTEDLIPITPTPEPGRGSKLSTGAIIGIGVGGALLIIL
ncbi:acid protease, partial [Lojkania enalia]